MKNNKGFTLIEVLITVAILAIIVAIAVPSYQNQVTKSRRADGIAMLNRVMEAQERYFVDNYSYVTNLTTLGFSADPATSEQGYYTVSASACAGSTIAQCVALTAAPQGAQSGDGNIVLDSVGGRGNAAEAKKWN